MKSKNQKQLDRWVKDWQKTQVALKPVHAMELQNLDYEMHSDLLDEMLTYACQQCRPQNSTGLIEQQRIFKIMRQTNSMPVTG